MHNKFERDFMRRTLELVRTYHGPYDATNLLNCLLGLLIVPKETSIDKVPDEPIADLGRWGISQQSIESFGRNRPKTLRQVVRSLRNAVAHFRFEPVHEKHKCIGFRFHDQSGFKATIKNEEMRILWKSWQSTWSAKRPPNPYEGCQGVSLSGGSVVSAVG